MNEPEIVLKSAELVLLKSQTELYSDIVKIGIPSLIALIGAVSTYLLTKSSHQKDMEIERLRADHDTRKEVISRTGELTKSVTIDLTKLHHTILTYASNLFAKLDMESNGHAFPEKSRNELSKQYQEVIEIFHDSFSIEARISLLGKKEIEEKFATFQLACSELPMKFDPSSTKESLEDLQRQMSKIKNTRSELLNELSKVFLIATNL